MSTDIDWQHELDASIGTGDDMPVVHYVAAGQRAVRRRRAVALVAGLGAAAVVAGVTWGLAPGGAPSSVDAPVATDPSQVASPTPTVEDEAETDAGADELVLPWRKGDPPAKVGSGGLQIRPGAVVHERRDDLFPDKDTESAALDISHGGERWWMVLEWDEGGGGYGSTKAGDGLYESFDDFVLAEVATGGMTSEPALDDARAFADLVKWTDGEVEPMPGVRVVRTVQDAVAPGDGSVGLVLSFRGEVTWMLITQWGGAASWSKESDSGWTTFDQWLTDQVLVSQGEDGLQLVRIDEDGTVAADLPGVEVVEQQADPDLERYGTSDSDSQSAVALVEWEDARWFVLAVRIDGRTSATTVGLDKAEGATTLDEFVAFMADKADEGGMR